MGMNEIYACYSNSTTIIIIILLITRLACKADKEQMKHN